MAGYRLAGDGGAKNARADPDAVEFLSVGRDAVEPSGNATSNRG
jgi:hypothetical protein